MKETPLDDLVAIIESDTSPESQREAAIAEVLIRLTIASKGGDRPPTAPPNP